MPLPRHRRSAQRGQSLLIFALTALVLFAIIGLGVDAGIGYFNSSNQERAAAAAALAGVTYMPDYFATADPLTGKNAQDRAKDVATANQYPDNGVANDGNGTHHITVVAEQVSCTTSANGISCARGCLSNCDRNRLFVEVCDFVDSTFLKLISIGAHKECRHAISEYLRPITLGQPGSVLGSTVDTLGTSTNAFILREEGYGANRSNGDGFTPNSADPPATQYASTDVHNLSTVRQTEVDWTATPPPFGAVSMTGRGGYNYDIYVPPNASEYVEVYNPSFSPDNNKADTSKTPNTGQSMHENDGMGNLTPNIDCSSGYSNPNCYSVTSYTLLDVTDVFQHARDKVISQSLFYPIDASNMQVTTPGAGYAATSTWRDVKDGFKVHSGGMPDVYHAWVDPCSYQTKSLPDSNNTSKLVQVVALPDVSACMLKGTAVGHHYRLRVDSLTINNKDPQQDATASKNEPAFHGYAMAVVPVDGAAPDSVSNTCAASGCSMGALSDMAIYTPIAISGSSGNFDMPVMSIPPEYADKIVTLDVFDPGDISCGASCINVISILQPDGTVATLGGNGTRLVGPDESGTENAISSCPLAPPLAQIQTICGGSNIYNGQWLRYYVHIPQVYYPGCTPISTPCAASSNPNNWYWSLRYSISNGNGGGSNDTVTLSVGFGGSPVHLIG